MCLRVGISFELSMSNHAVIHLVLSIYPLIGIKTLKYFGNGWQPALCPQTLQELLGPPGLSSN